MKLQHVGLLALSLTGGPLACGSSTVGTGGTGSTTPGVSQPDGSQAAQAAHDSVDNAADSSTVASRQSPGTDLMARLATPPPSQRRDIISAGALIDTTFAYQGCDVGFVGLVNAAEGNLTLDANLTYSGATCRMGRTLSGQTQIVTTYGQIGATVSVTENMKQTFANGDIVTITSATTDAPTYVLSTADNVSSNGNVTLTATLNEHRHRATKTGTEVFDFTVTSDANNPLQVVNSFAAVSATDTTQTASLDVQTRTIVSGATTLVHNVAKYTAVHTFDHLSRTPKLCNCPVSGSLQQDVTYNDDSGKAYSRVYTFTGCGTANVVVSHTTDPNIASGSVTWDACR